MMKKRKASIINSVVGILAALTEWLKEAFREELRVMDIFYMQYN